MHPEPTEDGSMTLRSERYGQTFHSRHGAVVESLHVFLEASGVGERLRQGQPTRVLEVGFGTGLNCWLAADLAAETGTQLEIVTLEQDLLPAEVVESLEYGQHMKHPQLLRRYLEQHPSQTVQLADHVSLTIMLGRAEEMQLPVNWADAVWHDAFSPEANAELWSEEFMGRLERALVPGGVLVTYSVKGEVRRRLQQLGFTVSKRPGPPGGKREMLLAVSPSGTDLRPD